MDYRRPVITDEIGDFMVNHAGYLCGRFGGVMLRSGAAAILLLLLERPPLRK